MKDEDRFAVRMCRPRRLSPLRAQPGADARALVPGAPLSHGPARCVLAACCAPASQSCVSALPLTSATQRLASPRLSPPRCWRGRTCRWPFSTRCRTTIAASSASQTVRSPPAAPIAAAHCAHSSAPRAVTIHRDYVALLLLVVAAWGVFVTVRIREVADGFGLKARRPPRVLACVRVCDTSGRALARSAERALPRRRVRARGGNRLVRLRAAQRRHLH
jgi:hypothetical protein